MDLDQFVKERRPRWHRLSVVLDQVDRRSLKSLAPPEAEELFALYRLVSSDLNLAQTRTGNPALLDYLESLVGRAYANLEGPREIHPLRAWWRIVRHRFPAALRAEKKLFAITFLTMAAGAIFGFLMTLLAPHTAEVFLPGEHLEETPRERVARLEDLERKGRTRVDSAEKHAAFSTFLFTHNIRVTIYAFALGFTFGIGTVAILFFNGAMLGSIACQYWQDGVLTFFIAWVGPHGSIELPCVLFGCTAGLMLARAQFRRDAGTLRQQLRLLRPALVDLLAGTASLLVIAGTIEGGFSQINEPTIPYALKIAVAAGLFGALLAYLFWMPVNPESYETKTGS